MGFHLLNTEKAWESKILKVQVHQQKYTPPMFDIGGIKKRAAWDTLRWCFRSVGPNTFILNGVVVHLS